MKSLFRDFMLVVLGLALSVTENAIHAAGRLTPSDELRTFQFADSRLTAELVASEPDVISPVAIAWDADGRLFVAEMRDYPNAPSGGAIRLLEDHDRDGRYETANRFADGLSFPNSVLPWRGGVLVTAAPDLLFLKDTDGDGRADERHVLFTGFGAGNQQLRANGLLWGLDGWVYGANGRSDGNVHAVEAVRGSGWLRLDARFAKTNSLRGRDFRFRPDTGEFETLAGRSQFGLARDDWGNRFLSWNTIPVRHEVFPDRFLARNPDLPAVEVLADLMPPGDAGEVFPLTPAPLVFNNESSSHFNALAGLHIFRGDALGPAYRGHAFMGETLRNLVHRRVLVPEGVTFSARRGEGEERAEFLRSGDPWFHPVNFATGPDGALYVVDFYRRFVEHPDFVPREMRDKLDWRVGNEHGRIWRIVRKEVPRDGKSKREFAAAMNPGLERGTTREFLRALESPNSWKRDTAQRLLLERRETNAAIALRKLARSAKLPETRVQALATLPVLGDLDLPTLVRALDDSNATARASKVRLMELVAIDTPSTARSLLLPPLPPLLDKAARLANDPDPRVRLAAVLALGSTSEQAVRENAISFLLTGETNRWIRIAAFSSSRTLTRQRIAKLLPPTSKSLRPPPAPLAPNPDRQHVVENFSPALQLAGDRQRGAATFAKLCLACHYLQGHGQRVGPDLSGINSKPAAALLIDVLDPNRVVAPDHMTYEALKTDGETVTGLFVSETETRIVLRHAGAPDETIPRSELKSLRATGRSLMPDGLEAGLSHQDLADLLQFLLKPDGALLPE